MFSIILPQRFFVYVAVHTQVYDLFKGPFLLRDDLVHELRFQALETDRVLFNLWWVAFAPQGLVIDVPGLSALLLLVVGWFIVLSTSDISLSLEDGYALG
ncbi:hypothetical protein LIER_01664 [Lithospermum erythrorhizon]|uniref:Uncharacterized protein n=1 Tax=Lithospermum erythrorhizon TaxID=34254 RepID=A0AAV3NQD9_LITER